MITSAEEFVALRTSEAPEMYQRAAHESAPDEVWHDVIERYPEMRKWVVHNKTVPPPILAKLASDVDPDVRATVAMTRRTPPVVLDALASDINPAVRLRVAFNAKTPSEVLRKLVNDPWDRVAEVARRRTT